MRFLCETTEEEEEEITFPNVKKFIFANPEKHDSGKNISKCQVKLIRKISMKDNRGENISRYQTDLLHECPRNTMEGRTVSHVNETPKENLQERQWREEHVKSNFYVNLLERQL